jgi:hypothetical protein
VVIFTPPIPVGQEAGRAPESLRTCGDCFCGESNHDRLTLTVTMLTELSRLYVYCVRNNAKTEVVFFLIFVGWGDIESTRYVGHWSSRWNENW